MSNQSPATNYSRDQAYRETLARSSAHLQLQLPPRNNQNNSNQTAKAGVFAATAHLSPPSNSYGNNSNNNTHLRNASVVSIPSKSNSLTTHPFATSGNVSMNNSNNNAHHQNQDSISHLNSKQHSNLTADDLLDVPLLHHEIARLTSTLAERDQLIRQFQQEINHQQGIVKFLTREVETLKKQLSVATATAVASIQEDQLRKRSPLRFTEEFGIAAVDVSGNGRSGNSNNNNNLRAASLNSTSVAEEMRSRKLEEQLHSFTAQRLQMEREASLRVFEANTMAEQLRDKDKEIEKLENRYKNHGEEAAKLRSNNANLEADIVLLTEQFEQEQESHKTTALEYRRYKTIMQKDMAELMRALRGTQLTQKRNEIDSILDAERTKNKRRQERLNEGYLEDDEESGEDDDEHDDNTNPIEKSKEKDQQPREREHDSASETKHSGEVKKSSGAVLNPQLLLLTKLSQSASEMLRNLPVLVDSNCQTEPVTIFTFENTSEPEKSKQQQDGKATQDFQEGESSTSLQSSAAITKRLGPTISRISSTISGGADPKKTNSSVEHSRSASTGINNNNNNVIIAANTAHSRTGSPALLGATATATPTSASKTPQPQQSTYVGPSAQRIEEVSGKLSQLEMHIEHVENQIRDTLEEHLQYRNGLRKGSPSQVYRRREIVKEVEMVEEHLHHNDDEASDDATAATTPRDSHSHSLNTSTYSKGNNSGAIGSSFPRNSSQQAMDSILKEVFTPKKRRSSPRRGEGSPNGGKISEEQALLEAKIKKLREQLQLANPNYKPISNGSLDFSEAAPGTPQHLLSPYQRFLDSQRKKQLLTHETAKTNANSMSAEQVAEFMSIRHNLMREMLLRKEAEERLTIFLATTNWEIALDFAHREQLRSEVRSHEQENIEMAQINNAISKQKADIRLELDDERKKTADLTKQLERAKKQIETLSRDLADERDRARRSRWLESLVDLAKLEIEESEERMRVLIRNDDERSLLLKLAADDWVSTWRLEYTSGSKRPSIVVPPSKNEMNTLRKQLDLARDELEDARFSSRQLEKKSQQNTRVVTYELTVALLERFVNLCSQREQIAAIAWERKNVVFSVFASDVVAKNNTGKDFVSALLLVDGGVSVQNALVRGAAAPSPMMISSSSPSLRRQVTFNEVPPENSPFFPKRRKSSNNNNNGNESDVYENEDQKRKYFFNRPQKKLRSQDDDCDENDNNNNNSNQNIEDETGSSSPNPFHLTEEELQEKLTILKRKPLYSNPDGSMTSSSAISSPMSQNDIQNSPNNNNSAIAEEMNLRRKRESELLHLRAKFSVHYDHLEKVYQQYSDAQWKMALHSIENTGIQQIESALDELDKVVEEFENSVERSSSNGTIHNNNNNNNHNVTGHPSRSDSQATQSPSPHGPGVSRLRQRNSNNDNGDNFSEARSEFSL